LLDPRDCTAFDFPELALDLDTEDDVARAQAAGLIDRAGARVL